MPTMLRPLRDPIAGFAYLGCDCSGHICNRGKMGRGKEGRTASIRQRIITA